MTLQLADARLKDLEALSVHGNAALSDWRPAPAATPQAAGIDSVLVVPRLFAAEEVGWLAEEARGLSTRLSGRPRPPAASSDAGSVGTLFDVDLHEEPFRRLAAHPRLLAHVRALLPMPLQVHRTRLIGGLSVEEGITAPRAVTAVVALRGGPGATLFARREGRTLAVALPSGSVAFLLADTAYAVHQDGRPTGSTLFVVTYGTSMPDLAFRQGILETTLSDDCLWPPAFACAG